MENASRKKTILLVSLWLVCFIPAGIFFFLVLLPHDKVLKQLKIQVLEKTQIYNSLKATRSQAQQNKIKAEIENFSQNFCDYIINGQELNNLDFILSQMGREKNFDSFTSRNLYEVKNNKFADFKYIDERRIKLSFVSDFKAFCAFVNELERHQPIIFVDLFNLTRDISGDSLPLAEMELAVLFEKQKSEKI